MKNVMALAFGFGGIAGMLLVFGVIAWLFPVTPPDRVLLQLAAIPCLLVLGWVAIGAPFIPKAGQGAGLLLCPLMPIGITLLDAVTTRHPPLSPFFNAAGVVLASFALGLTATWLMTGLRGVSGPVRAEKMMIAGIVFFLSGIGFFQPLVLLINARGDALPALVARGTVVRLYETHGKGAAPYVQFSGPAAAFNSTGTDGEFKLAWKQYNALHVGDAACVTIHTGLLHLRWWTIDDCGLGAQTTAALAQWARGDHAGAIGALETLVKAQPQALNALTPDWITAAEQTLKQQRDIELFRRLLVLLVTPGFQPGNPDFPRDGYRYQLAGVQLFQHDRAGAAATMAQIEDPQMLLEASLDPARASLLPPGFAAGATIKAAIARLQSAIGSQPASLGPVLRLAQLHAMLGDGQAAIDVLRAHKPGGDHPFMAFSDAEQAQWWLQLAQAYRLIGQDDEAIHQFGRSMVNDGINQHRDQALLELAQLQIDGGHPADALTTLDKASSPGRGWTAYGKALIRSMRACAEAGAGRRPAAQADYSAVRDDQAAPPMLAMATAACTGNDDAAAATLIVSLVPGNTELRLQLSHFAPWPGAYRGTRAQRDLARLAQRADVRAALNRAGGAGTFDIPPLPDSPFN